MVDNWQVFGPLKHNNGAYEYTIELNYGGGEAPFYKALNPNDIIPAMWSQLVPSTGSDVHLLKGGSYASHFYVAYYWRDYHKQLPLANREWLTVDGLNTWKAIKVGEGDFPGVNFWVTGTPGQCFSSTTKAMYRHNKHWVPIPHAPKQTTPEVCLPTSG